MSPDDKSVPMPPVTVTVIGGTGDGGAPLTTGTTGTTPDHQPNLVVQVVPPLVALLVRFASFYVSSFMGSITLALTPDGTKMLASIGVHDLGPILMAAGWAALIPALYDLGKNLVTIFSNLEKRFPLLTGNV